MRIVLASQSPRRRDLFEEAGLKFEVRVSEADETLSSEESENPARAACLLAERKAGMVVQELLDADAKISEPTMVIGADTMVVLDGRIFGKPHSPSEAVGMLRKLSGRTHEVVTGVAVWGLLPNEDGTVSVGRSTFSETSHVRFRHLSDAEIDAYVAQGECFDKAGAYAIQGGGGQFVEGYDGPLDNIIGLPVQRLLNMFPDMGE